MSDWICSLEKSILSVIADGDDVMSSCTAYYPLLSFTCAYESDFESEFGSCTELLSVNLTTAVKRT